MKPIDLKVENQICNIIIKPWWFNLTPWTGNKTAQAYAPYIFLPLWMYKEITSTPPNPWYVSVILHEQEHINRQRDFGPTLAWTFRYIFNRRFRFEEEIAASIPQFNHLKKHHLQFDIDRKAKQLSGLLYMHCIDYKTAHQTLLKAWELA